MRPSVVLTTLAVLAASCSHSEPAPAVPSSPALDSLGAPVRFAYAGVDGDKGVSSATLRGRPSVLVFITSFDLASQAQVRFLSMVKMRHRPRINAAAVLLEPKENLPLIEAFRATVGLDYPLAFGDAELLAGGGPFGEVSAVPTTVVLDREGRIVAKRTGLLKDDEIEDLLGKR